MLLINNQSSSKHERLKLKKFLRTLKSPWSNSLWKYILKCLMISNPIFSKSSMSKINILSVFIGKSFYIIAHDGLSVRSVLACAGWQWSEGEVRWTGLVGGFDWQAGWPQHCTVHTIAHTTLLQYKACAPSSASTAWIHNNKTSARTSPEVSSSAFFSLRGNKKQIDRRKICRLYYIFFCQCAKHIKYKA